MIESSSPQKDYGTYMIYSKKYPRGLEWDWQDLTHEVQDDLLKSLHEYQRLNPTVTINGLTMDSRALRQIALDIVGVVLDETPEVSDDTTAK